MRKMRVALDEAIIARKISKLMIRLTPQSGACTHIFCAP
jgi:hypothetical protein